MTDKEQKVSVSVFNWGPCVVKLKMMDEFKQLLIDEAKNNKQDYRDKLAGIIEKETAHTKMPKISAELRPELCRYHDGKLSFVAYLQIPDELKKEHESYIGKSCGPGGIQFVYGDGPRDCVTYQSFFPEEGDIFIFPAWLKHWVAPFKSKVTRISVSGNVHDSAPLNNIVKFAPEYLKKKS